MRRRQLITLLGGAGVIWPLAARTQQAGTLPTIGFLGAGTASAYGAWAAAFATRMRELGWSDGSTVTIQYRWAEGRSERLAAIAAEFVRLKVAVIVTNGNAAVAATKQTTSDIPIVFPIANDPLGAGLVASLGRPGGNATGTSIQESDTAGKRLELLHEGAPGLRRVAVMVNAANPSSVAEVREVRKAVAAKLGHDERHPLRHQPRHESDIARQPVELRHQDAGLGGTGSSVGQGKV